MLVYCMLLVLGFSSPALTCAPTLTENMNRQTLIDTSRILGGKGQSSPVMDSAKATNENAYAAPPAITPSSERAPKPTDQSTAQFNPCRNCLLSSIGKLKRPLPPGISQADPEIKYVLDSLSSCYAAQITCRKQKRQMTILDFADQPILRSDVYEEDNSVLLICNNQNRWTTKSGIPVTNVNCFYQNTAVF